MERGPFRHKAVVSGRNGRRRRWAEERLHWRGGELATAREVLKHSGVERVVMVDIDPTVVEVCREHLPEWGGEAVAGHPKLEYVVGDVRRYLEEEVVIEKRIRAVPGVGGARRGAMS